MSLLPWLLKVAVSGGLLAIILWQFPAGQIWTAMLGLPFGLWFGVLAAFVSGHLLLASKWWLIAARPGGLPLKSAFGAHVAGLTANLCLPGVAGGDVVRAGLIMRKSSDRANVVVGSIADRLLDSAAILVLACAGGFVLFGMDALAFAGPWLLLGLLATLGAAALVVLLFPYLRRSRLAAKAASGFEVLRRQPGVVCLGFAVSLAVQSAFVALNILLAHAFGLELPTAAWFFAWSLAKLIAILPISLAGLGVREASLAGLLAPLGADPALVVAVGLTWQSILLATGLIGGLVLTLRSRGRLSFSSAEAVGNARP